MASKPIDPKPAEGPTKPGDNPNKSNAQRRKGARPNVKNQTNSSASKMSLAWIDPIPTSDIKLEKLGIEHNVKDFPSGYIELNNLLPVNIADPFCDTVRAIGDRINMADDDKDLVGNNLISLCFFKCARQLYSTMLPTEKSANQTLKSVFYDDTPIPTHMAGAISMIGHLETKVGPVLIRNASTLFKRWISRGLQLSSPDFGTSNQEEPQFTRLVWPEQDGLDLVHRLARDKIETLTNQRYTLTIGQDDFTVSMPKLTDQTLVQYYHSINNIVPEHEQLRDLTSLLQINLARWKTKTIGNDRNIDDALNHLNLTYAPDHYLANELRDSYEGWTSAYTTLIRARVDAIFKTGPAPTGSHGFAAQTVSSSDTSAQWQFPLSDSDLALGFTFSPMNSFVLTPKLIGYSKRRADAVASEFALQDGRSMV